jgi:tryptophan 2,3-dioxygenase
MAQGKDITYSDYLKLRQLLDLQHPRSSPAEHDETLFIIIHQVYELWFKQLLHEFDKIGSDFSAGDLFGAIASLKRVRMILKTLVGQLDVLETMTPLSFMSFRGRLESASGFQSAQFREVEFVLGYKRRDMVEHFTAGTPERARLARRLAERSLVDRFYDFVARQGVEIPDEIRGRDVTEAHRECPAIQPGLLRLYKDRPEVAILMELMIDIDEGFQEWRYRHVKMVERTIGNKAGTGGSSGVEFLKHTLFMPLFPDLWAIRRDF